MPDNIRAEHGIGGDLELQALFRTGAQTVNIVQFVHPPAASQLASSPVMINNPETCC